VTAGGGRQICTLVLAAPWHFGEVEEHRGRAFDRKPHGTGSKQHHNRGHRRLYG